MLTPRTTLARRVTAALDASPSRIPVLLGGCGTGRTTLLRQLRERLGQIPPGQIKTDASRQERACVQTILKKRLFVVIRGCENPDNMRWDTLQAH